ncbi:alpha-L-fucosidase [Niabella aurantiaca]|uniref:alpha-L-fucosidase n=1 Tax=Niabella aurantiaca TaxID=379900 RepID=UPI00059422A1|nr:alpha-L-fucosidase [Niabella aurantiaca]
MKIRFFLCVLFAFHLNIYMLPAQQSMNEMWGQSQVKGKNGTTRRAALFDEANYAMFIHWGLFSQLANEWKGKTYYGIGEWLMNENMAKIPVQEYKKVVKDFNPEDFDAYAIARLAKDAGMKYIVITSKHHDGFAMYDSKVCDFNVVKQTPFGRDPMKELSRACKELGLGFGFYYSHNQDWSCPGGNGGPAKDAAGNPKTFDDYFREKCLPQVEEITKNYGDIALVWFDTPGGMPEKYAQQLVETVHRNQPGALVSGRVGYNLGDYQTLGDMEVPLENIKGLWESIDVTNDSWGYAWYDENWKSPRQVLTSLVATVARGGTFMLNVGPDRSGVVPVPAQQSLRASGKWIARYPQVIYGAGASPWKHALPWGDVTTHGGELYLSVFNWPAQGKLYVPGLLSEVSGVSLLSGRQKKLRFRKEGNWLVIDVPFLSPDPLASVIKLIPKNKTPLQVDPAQAVDPEEGIALSAKFAAVQNGAVRKSQWMEKFGEWKTAYVVNNWKDNTAATWEISIKDPGYYAVNLKYAGSGRMVWRVGNSEGTFIQNQQGADHIYTSHPIGWLKFKQAGKHRVTVQLVEGERETASLTELQLKPVAF